MFTRQEITKLIKRYYKPVLAWIGAFLLGYFLSNNGAFLILGSGKNVTLQMTESHDGIETDTTDNNEVNFFPRTPVYLVIHCDAVYPWVYPDKDWYTNCFKTKYGTNWRYGYHASVLKDGKFIELVHIDRSPKLEYNEISWGVKGKNSICINLAYSGGINDKGNPDYTLTVSQLNSLRLAIKYYKAIFPDLIVVPHNYFNKAKACPVIDVKILEEEPL